MVKVTITLTNVPEELAGAIIADIKDDVPTADGCHDVKVKATIEAQDGQG